MRRPASVTYDRAASAFACFDPAGYDWPSLIEGADWLVVGGITAALGERALAALNFAVEGWSRSAKPGLGIAAAHGAGEGARGCLGQCAGAGG